jgi:Holliday junction resolvase RusA-like endonuclease
MGSHGRTMNESRRPFEWKFTRSDLDALVKRMKLAA